MVVALDRAGAKVPDIKLTLVKLTIVIDDNRPNLSAKIIKLT